MRRVALFPMEIEKTRRNNNIRVWWFVSHLRSMYNDFPPVVTW